MVWWILGIPIFVLIVYLLYTVYSPTYAEKDLLRLNAKAYLKARSESKSHQEAVGYVLRTRYPLSDKNRQKVLNYYKKSLCTDDNEFDQLKKLIYSIYNYEVLGGEKGIDITRVNSVIHKFHYEQIEEAINKINQKYQIPLRIN